jgi:hypothetical protein
MAVDKTLFMIDRYDVTFVGMVPPRQIECQAHSHGLRNGNMVIKVETTSQHGETIIPLRSLTLPPYMSSHHSQC